jgi:large subunit ribosomal protein L33
MGKAKGVRVTVTLESRTEEGVFRYTTQKNKRNTPNKLEIRKYCPKSRKHQLFKEIK